MNAINGLVAKSCILSMPSTMSMVVGSNHCKVNPPIIIVNGPQMILVTIFKPYNVAKQE
jgi:hypothetical protein